MRRKDRLTALSARRLTEPGLHHDGSGLYLQIMPTCTKSWILKFQRDGRSRQMGLGPFPLVPLADARHKRDVARRLLLEGIDPIEHRKADLQRRRLESARSITFRDAAQQYLVAHRPGWQNIKHASQWDTTLATYVFPVLVSLPVAAVDVALVMKVLEPIWAAKPETAGRVRGRIESILDWSAARGFRSGDNPARWRGHLDKLLPKKMRLHKVEHHTALPYAELGAFMVTLRAREAMSALALELVILTAARAGEVLGARWDEIDLAAGVWTVPARRMKGRREHRVPLSPPAVALLERLQAARQGPLVFAGRTSGRSLSDAAMRALVSGMNVRTSVHGFRSTFRDWAAERTSFPSEVIEMALAHAVGNKVEAAYRRGDLFDKRRKLMEAWAEFCNAPANAEGADVIPISRRTEVPA